MMAVRHCREAGAGDAAPDPGTPEFAIAAIVARQKSNQRPISGCGVSSSSSLMSGPGVEIVGAGLLPLPVDAGVYSAFIRRASEPSRPEWSIKPDCLLFKNPVWEGGRVPGVFIDAVARDAGAPSGAAIVASLRGLLVTGPGGSPLHPLCRIDQPGACNELTPWLSHRTLHY